MRIILITILLIQVAYAQQLEERYKSEGPEKSSIEFLDSQEFIWYSSWGTPYKGAYEISTDSVLFYPYELNADTVQKRINFSCYCFNDPELEQNKVKLIIGNMTPITLESIVIRPDVGGSYNLPRDTINQLGAIDFSDTFDVRLVYDSDSSNTHSYTISIGDKKTHCGCEGLNTATISVFSGYMGEVDYPVVLYITESGQKLVSNLINDSFPFIPY